MLPSTSTSSVKNLKQQFEKKPDPTNQNHPSPITRPRGRSEKIENLEKKLKEAGKVVETQKIEIGCNTDNVDNKTKAFAKIIEEQTKDQKYTKRNVPKEKTVYINPFSQNIKLDVFKGTTTVPVKTFSAFINTQGLEPGAYNCKPYIELDKENKKTIHLNEFNFKVLANGDVTPDFHDLKVLDVNFEFKDKDKPVTGEEANCKFITKEKEVTEFKCKTDAKGRFNQVLPPGTVDIRIPSCNIRMESTIIEPKPIYNREESLKIDASLKTTSINASLAGSSIVESGDVVVLGDASGSMEGIPFITLIECLNTFVTNSLNRKQNIAIALWGSKTKWFDNGNFLDSSKVKDLNKFLNSTSSSLGGTELFQALEETFRQHPNIENVLVMCDGEIQDIKDVNSFAPFRDAHSSTRFHFTGIGSSATRNLEEMAQYGNGNYEFSDIKKHK